MILLYYSSGLLFYFKASLVFFFCKCWLWFSLYFFCFFITNFLYVMNVNDIDDCLIRCIWWYNFLNAIYDIVGMHFNVLSFQIIFMIYINIDCRYFEENDRNNVSILCTYMMWFVTTYIYMINWQHTICMKINHMYIVFYVFFKQMLFTSFSFNYF